MPSNFRHEGAVLAGLFGSGRYQTHRSGAAAVGAHAIVRGRITTRVGDR